MSQYGSEGAARAGLTSAQIMDFYYPGTTAGQAGGQVKVWITADRDRVLTVVARPGLKVRDLATKKKWTSARQGRDQVAPDRRQRDQDGRVVLQARAG